MRLSLSWIPWLKAGAWLSGAAFLGLALLAMLAWHYQENVRSDYFRALDHNSDDYVTLQEWMTAYGPHDHPWSECAGKIFEPADCDHDQRLSWSEYWAARKHDNYCGRPYSLFLEWQFKKPVVDPQTGLYVLLPPERLPPSQPAAIDLFGPARVENLPESWPQGQDKSLTPP